MLSESECRILAGLGPLLIEDFDPTDALVFLELSDVLKEDSVDRIKAKMTRRERLSELMRTYRREAHDLFPLIDCFTSLKQPHLAELLKHGLANVCDKNAANTSMNNNALTFISPDAIERFERERRERKMLISGMPRACHSVSRSELVNEVADKLRDNSKRDAFFVVLHGVAGSGKTALAVQTLKQCADLIGECFENVLWLKDGYAAPGQAFSLFSDLLLLLKDYDISAEVPVKNSSSALLKKQIADAMIDNPNVLIVLDDVVQAETVRWADQLNLRVLATTRDSSIFDVAVAPLDIVHVGELDQLEAAHLFDQAKLNVKQNLSVVAELAHNCSGNLAMLTILTKLAAGKVENLDVFLSRLKRRGLSSFHAVTAYSYASLYDAFSASVMRLSQIDRDALACATAMPPGVWITIDIWSIVIPVDVCDPAGDAALLTAVSFQLRRLVACGGWLEASKEDDNKFRLPTIIHHYLKESVDRNSIQSIVSSVKSLAERPTTCQFFRDHAQFFNDL